MTAPTPASPAAPAGPSSYPRQLDETVVRLVAGEVLVVAIVAVATRQLWLFLPLAVDFALRAVLGPKASPLAAIARRIRPRIRTPRRLVAAPPKRFAMTMGVVFSTAAGVLWLTGPALLAWLVAAIMIVFPALESLAGICVGCQVFGLLMRLGVIPDEVCLECADITRRQVQH